MEWIKVKDKLPEERQEILFCVFKSVEYGRYKNGKFEAWYAHPEMAQVQDKISCWMSLPKPPKK